MVATENDIKIDSFSSFCPCSGLFYRYQKLCCRTFILPENKNRLLLQPMMLNPNTEHRTPGHTSAFQFTKFGRCLTLILRRIHNTYARFCSYSQRPETRAAREKRRETHICEFNFVLGYDSVDDTITILVFVVGCYCYCRQ